MRRSRDELVADAVGEILEALATLGVAASPANDAGAEAADAVLTVDGQQLAVEVKSVVPDDGGPLVRARARRSLPVVLVADRLAAPMRDRLRRADVSFYDRRGHLRLWLPPALRIDTTVPVASAGTVGGGLSSQVGREVA